MRRSKLSLFLVVSLGGLLSGCAGSSGMPFDYGAEGAARIQQPQVQDGIKALENSPPCCTSLAGLTYLPVDKPGKKDFLIDNSSEVFVFSSGKSFVKGIALPRADGAINLALSSPIINSVYVPSLLLLDGAFKPLRLYDEDQLRYQKAGLFSGERYYGEFEIKPQDNARYLVLFTTAESMSGETLLAPPDSQALESGTTRAAKRTFMNEPIPHSAIGAVRLAFNYLPDSSRQSAALLDKQDVIRLEAESAVSSSATLSELPDKSAPTQPSVENAGSDPATLQPETEAMFIELIEQAVRAGDLNKAMAIVKDAERAGSTKARDALVNSLK